MKIYAIYIHTLDRPMLADNLRAGLPGLAKDIRSFRQIRIQVRTDTQYGNRDFNSCLRFLRTFLPDLTRLDSAHVEEPAKELPHWPKAIHKSG